MFSLADGQWNIIDIPAASFPNNISVLETDSNNALWALVDGDSGKFIGKYQDGQWSVYDTLFSGYHFFNIADICIDKNNKVWVAAEYYYHNIGIFRFDGTHLDTVYTEQIPAYPIISDLKADFEGNILVQGNYNYYVEYYWFKVFDSNSLIENELFPSPGSFGLAFASTEANQWIVGLVSAAYYNGQTWIVYNSSNSNLPSLPANLYCVCSDHHNNIWIGGSDGLYTTKKK